MRTTDFRKGHGYGGALNITQSKKNIAYLVPWSYTRENEKENLNFRVTATDISQFYRSNVVCIHYNGISNLDNSTRKMIWIKSKNLRNTCEKKSQNVIFCLKLPEHTHYITLSINCERYLVYTAKRFSKQTLYLFASTRGKSWWNSGQQIRFIRWFELNLMINWRKRL